MSTLIVRTADLSRCPEAFQQYVKDWFIPAQVLGADVMKVSQLLFWPPQRHSYPQKGKDKGVAPSHSVDLREYTAGLNGRSLNEWIRENEGKLVWSFHSAERHSDCVDDD